MTSRRNTTIFRPAPALDQPEESPCIMVKCPNPLCGKPIKVRIDQLRSSEYQEVPCPFCLEGSIDARLPDNPALRLSALARMGAGP